MKLTPTTQLVIRAAFDHDVGLYSIGYQLGDFQVSSNIIHLETIPDFLTENPDLIPIC